LVNYVGSWEYHGLDGVERSTALYRALFDNRTFDAVDQVAEGDRIASRFVPTGSNRGRQVRLWGTTISRLRDGRIVEDYSALDSLELRKQLGVWRTLLAAPRMLRALRDGRRADRDLRVHR
jgi:predicted ester cyclase